MGGIFKRGGGVIISQESILFQYNSNHFQIVMMVVKYINHIFPFSIQYWNATYLERSVLSAYTNESMNGQVQKLYYITILVTKTVFIYVDHCSN